MRKSIPPPPPFYTRPCNCNVRRRSTVYQVYRPELRISSCGDCIIGGWYKGSVISLESGRESPEEPRNRQGRLDKHCLEKVEGEGDIYIYIYIAWVCRHCGNECGHGSALDRFSELQAHVRIDCTTTQRCSSQAVHQNTYTLLNSYRIKHQVR